MARVLDKVITVTGVSDDSIQVQSGAEGYTYTKSELADAASGAMDKRAMILGNIGVNLCMHGVNLNDDIAIKSAVESRTYKIVE